MKSIYFKLLKLKFYIKIYTKISLKKLTIIWMKSFPIISFVGGGIISVIAICCVLYAWLNFFYLVRHFTYVVDLECQRIYMYNRLMNEPLLDAFDDRVLEKARRALQNPGRIDPYRQLVNQIYDGSLVNANYCRTAVYYGSLGILLGGGVIMCIIWCAAPAPSND